MSIDARVRLHPLNTDFQWQPHTGPFRALSEDQARSYDENGYFLFEGAFDADELAAVMAEIDPLEEELNALLREVEGGRISIARADEITFTTHLVTRSPRLREFVGGRVFQDLCADLIGPDVRLYWDQAVYKRPGTESPFPWHQDNGYTFIQPQQYLTCWVALTDATEDNGCPWVVPGLHTPGTLEHEITDLGMVCLREGEAPDAVALPARAGDIVVFSSLTPHSTGPNRTDAVRKSYIVQFAPDGASTMDHRNQPAGLAADPDRQFPVLVDGHAP